jgi:hypothetical protein
MLAGRTLLSYVLPRDLYTIFGERRAQDIKPGTRPFISSSAGFAPCSGSYSR